MEFEFRNVKLAKKLWKATPIWNKLSTPFRLSRELSRYARRQRTNRSTSLLSITLLSRLGISWEDLCARAGRSILSKFWKIFPACSKTIVTSIGSAAILTRSVKLWLMQKRNQKVWKCSISLLTWLSERVTATFKRFYSEPEFICTETTMACSEI